MNGKTLLTAINAKYIHSNLAVRYLKKYCQNHTDEIDIAEFSINDNIYTILKKLYSTEADILGFSCYIWNISLILNICSSLKKARPEVVIILGGPEVSYDPKQILTDNDSIDFIVIGEGEQTLYELLGCLKKDTIKLSDIYGIAYRKDTEIFVTPPRALMKDLDILPFPYDVFSDLKNKIIYYETSRGCPFNCQYCLSSTIHGVRYLSMTRLKKDIKFFTDSGVKQVKLVDRTFNSDINRSVEIMQYIIDLNSSTNFHLEITADLVTESFFKILEKAPIGMFQLEIGIQSTNPQTLSEIKRKTDFNKTRLNIEKIKALKNTHIHLDLIAGLPYEDMESFEKSFNDVYSINADVIQLGFLKLLKGSGIRKNLSNYGILHHDFPPYEVIKTSWMSYEDILMLKDIEHVFELYYNSGRFKNSLNVILKETAKAPFDFYRLLSLYWNKKGYYDSSRSMNELFTILYQFAAELLTDKNNSMESTRLNEYLKLDWLLYNRSGSMPCVIKRFDHSSIKEKIRDYMKTILINNKGFESFKGMTVRELLKHVNYEVFESCIFEDMPPKGQVVMFYLNDTTSGGKTPFFSTVLIEEIILH